LAFLDLLLAQQVCLLLFLLHCLGLLANLLGLLLLGLLTGLLLVAVFLSFNGSEDDVLKFKFDSMGKLNVQEGGLIDIGVDVNEVFTVFPHAHRRQSSGRSLRLPK